MINISHENAFISIGLGEDSVSVPFTHDLFCEKLAILTYFHNFDFKLNFKHHSQSTKYFNQRLLNYTHKSSSDSHYIFFALKVTQSVNFHNQINITMRKVTSGKLTAGMLSSNFKEESKRFYSK